MAFKKYFILGFIILACFSTALSGEMAGAWFGEAEGTPFMILIRELTPSNYYFKFFGQAEESPPLAMAEKEKGIWIVAEEPSGIDISFSEGECRFFHSESSEEALFPKLLGPPGKAAGEYVYPGSGYRTLMLLSVTDDGISRIMKITEWDTLDSAVITDTGSDEKDVPLIFSGKYYTYEINFEGDGRAVLEIEDEGISVSIRKNKSTPLYESYIPVSEEGISGIYRGLGEEVEIMIIVESKAEELYDFDLLSEDEEIDFGSAQWTGEGESRQAVFEEAILSFSGDDIILEDKVIGETLVCPPLSLSGKESSGIYIAKDVEEDYAMLFNVENEGDIVHLKAEVWYIDLSFDARTESDHLYSIGEERDQFLLAFAGDACRVIVEEQLYTLHKIGTDTEASGQNGKSAPEQTEAGVRAGSVRGFIPDLSTAGAVEEYLSEYERTGSELFRNRNASGLFINLGKTKAVNLRGFSPVRISPDGRYIFAAGSSETGIYDLESGMYIYREPAETTALDFPSVQWAPDSSKVAWCEDFYRMLLDADLHVIYTGPEELRGIGENLTDDGISSFTLSGDAPDADIPLFWTDGNHDPVFLRNNLSHGMSFRKYNTSSGGFDILTPTLDNHYSIVNAAFDRSGGKVYFTRFPNTARTPTGIWLMDPDEEMPVELTETISPEGGPAVVTEISLNGEWLLVYYPGIAAAPAGTYNHDAFYLYSVVDDRLAPLLSDLSGVERAGMIINNAVFSPDGTKILFAYGKKGEQDRHIAVADTGSGEAHIIYSLKDPTAGISPQMSRSGGVVGLAWCLNDSFYVSVDSGKKGLILRP